MTRLAPHQQLALDLPHTERSEEQDFLPSSSNAAALAHLGRWPDWPTPVTVLFGPEGSGKTHLARIWAARARAVWLESAGPWLLPPRDLFPAPASCLAIDEADHVWDEQVLFHLFNLVTERRGSLLLTATLPPADGGSVARSPRSPGHPPGRGGRPRSPRGAPASTRARDRCQQVRPLRCARSNQPTRKSTKARTLPDRCRRCG